MAQNPLLDAIEQAFPDRRELIRIEKITLHPETRRWTVHYTAPHTLSGDTPRLQQVFEQFSAGSPVELVHTPPRSLPQTCSAQQLCALVCRAIQSQSAAAALAGADWQLQGSNLVITCSGNAALPDQRAIRDLVAQLTGFTPTVRLRTAQPAAASAQILLGGRPVEGECTPIAQLTTESGVVNVRGEVVTKELRQTARMRNNEPMGLFTFDLYDGTSTISMSRYDTLTTCTELDQHIAIGDGLCVRGACEEHYKTHELCMRPQLIQTMPIPRREDTAARKRVELHLHTQMSALDSVLPLSDAIACAKRWGHPAIAITDHGVVQAFPQAHMLAKKQGIRLLLGMEAYLTADHAQILSGGASQPFDGSFVVFDLETTGLDAQHNGITEIGAVRVRGGEVTQRFETLVNPGQPIPANISVLTGITDDMVRDAPSISQALADFAAFAGDDILVAHNASFDMSFLRSHGARHDITFANPVLDTLALSRVLFPTQRRHRLDTLARKFKIKQLSHHRASDDAQTLYAVLRALFTLCTQQKGIEDVGLLNEAFASSGAGEDYHATLLVRNEEGLRNLYKLISLSHLEHFRSRPRIPRSVLQAHREGLLVGSACEAGEVYRAMLTGEHDRALQAARFYDYIEIMPDGNNTFLVRNGRVQSVEALHAINRDLLALAEKLDKPVVATSDAHFLEPDHAIYRAVLQASQGYADADEQAALYLRTTDEMLAEFAYLGEEQAHRVVVDNTNAIADMIEDVAPLPPYKLYAPEIDGAEQSIVNDSMATARRIYGDPLPAIVQQRLDKELGAITKYGFAVLFYIAQAMVRQSLDDGYLVGSRGSVGSSFVATMTGITEVNPLPPHYVCPQCQFSDFAVDTQTYASGPDLPAQDCPRCGAALRKEGFDIPFEVFLGFEGDKVPDIDLNFSGEYQSTMHKFVETLFGQGNVFRAGTISSVAGKTSFGMVKKYMEERGKTVTTAEVDRIARGVAGVKRTTGQHPGGIIVVPKQYDITYFTPIQHPADDRTSGIITTHFDFNSLHDRLVKLDVLGHDDPTMLHMLQDLTGVDPRTIPLDDPDTLSLFTSTQALGVTPDQINCPVGTNGVPEFGTRFVRGMLEDTSPTTMAELVRISGLSHGTDVWTNNAQLLVREGTATLKEVICTRDDIMNALIQYGVDSKTAFDTMENVRKGKGLKENMEAAMHAANVPEWFIKSCKLIKYMFPKAHAVAYVTMGLRVAWFKVHYPREYYAAYYTVRADDFDAALMLEGIAQVRRKVLEWEAVENTLPVKEQNKLVILQIVLEMLARGISFTNVDLYKSSAARFELTDDTRIRPPLNALPGLGATAAGRIVRAREEAPFRSEEDLKKRTSISSAVMEVLRDYRCLDGLPKSDQVSLFDMF